MMRTALTIDDDIAARLEGLCKDQGLSLKQAVNLLLREGLGAYSTPQRAKRFRTKPCKLGLRTGIDPGKLNQLVDSLL